MAGDVAVGVEPEQHRAAEPIPDAAGESSRLADPLAPQQHEHADEGEQDAQRSRGAHGGL